MEFVHFGSGEIENADFEAAEIVVLPLCYESAPSYGAGSGEGPLHMLNASVQLERLDEETLIDWSLQPIHTRPPVFPQADPELAVEEMEGAALETLARGKFLLSLCGDHAASIGPIRAAARIHPDLGVLQVDAHLDLRDSWNGSRFNHACVMRRVTDDMRLPAVQVGIRAISPEEAEFVRMRKLTPFYAHEIDPADESWMERAIDLLPPKVYLTLDLDGLDPSVIPGTGTPEPGGLSYRQAVRLIRMLCRKREIVAADINELVKIEGSQVSEYTAARLAAKIIGCLAADRSRRSG